MRSHRTGRWVVLLLFACHHSEQRDLQHYSWTKRSSSGKFCHATLVAGLRNENGLPAVRRLYLRPKATIYLRGGTEHTTPSFNIKTGQWGEMEGGADEDMRTDGGTLVKHDGMMTADQCITAADEAAAEGEWDEAVSLLNVAMEDKIDEVGRDSLECVEVYYKFASVCMAWHNHSSSSQNSGTQASNHAGGRTSEGREDMSESDEASTDDDDEDELEMTDDFAKEDMENPLSSAWKVLKRAEKILKEELGRRQHQFRFPKAPEGAQQAGKSTDREHRSTADGNPQPDARDRKQMSMLADVNDLLAQLVLTPESAAWLPKLWPVDRRHMAKQFVESSTQLRQECQMLRRA